MSPTRWLIIGAITAPLLATAIAPAAAAPRASQPAAASDVPATESLGSAGGWSAYASQDASGKVCFVAGHPKKSEAAGITRRTPIAMVTHRPAENIANVVSFVEGYTVKPGSDVTLDVGGKKFTLFTRDDSAWARTSDLDRAIVTALNRAGSVVVKGEPEKGRPTTDVYSLVGFPKALALIDKACGVKRGGEPTTPAHVTPHHRRKPRPVHH